MTTKLRTVSIVMATGLLVALIGMSVASAAGTQASAPMAKLPPKPGPSQINVGGFFTLSGTIVAPQALWGAQLGVAYENKKRINKTSRLRLIVKDHQCAADNMRGVFLSAVGSKIVAGITSCSGPSKASAPLAAANKVLNFNVGGSDPSMAGISPYLFSSLVLGNVTAKVALDFIKNSIRKSKLAVIYSNDPVGNALNDEIAERSSRYGIEVTTTASYETGQQDFSAVVAKVRASRPDVIYLATLGTETGLIVKQLRQQGISAELISYAGVYGNIASVAGSALNGMLYTSPYLNLNGATYKAYASAFTAAHPGVAPGYVDVTAYDTMRIIAQALRVSAATGKPRWWLGPALRAAVLKIKTFDGLAGGSYSFQPNGTVQRPVQLYQWVDGAPKLVSLYSLKRIAGLK